MGPRGGPHISSGIGPPGPIPLGIWGPGGPKTQGAHFTATPAPVSERFIVGVPADDIKQLVGRLQAISVE